MAQLAAHEPSHEERVTTFRSVINEIRSQGHRLLDVGLFLAVDEVAGTLNSLEEMYVLFADRELEERAPGDGSATATPGVESAKGSASSPLVASRRARLTATRGGRRVGIEIIPGSVSKARKEAGLSLSQVAGKEVTRVAIWYIEQGRTRPSLETLRLIAERTGKDLSFFTGDTTRVYV